MEKYLELFDRVLLKPISNLEPHKRFFFETKDATSETGHSLIVEMAATFAGVVTWHNALYLPSRMRNSVYTMLPNAKRDYCIPILVGHDDSKDPIGRIISAEYIDTTKGLGITDSVIEAINYGSLSGKSLQKAVNHFSKNYLTQDNWRGMGFILVKAKITDPDAIRKILDERYLPVSSSQRTNQAICSICFQDWLDEDGICEHKPGSVYDGKKAFLIAGDFFYNEISCVNQGANPFAKIIGVSKDEMLVDSVKETPMLEYSFKAFRQKGSDLLELNDSLILGDKQEDLMNLQDKVRSLYITLYGEDYSSISANIEKPEDKDPGAILQALIKLLEVEMSSMEEKDFLKLPEDKMTELLKTTVEKMTTPKAEVKDETPKLLVDGENATQIIEDVLAEFYPTKDEEKECKEYLNALPQKDGVEIADLILTSIEDFFIKKYGETDIMDLTDPEKGWDVFKKELIQAGLFDSLKDKDLYSEDAKLSAEQRKKLNSKSFCGPNRSFPCSDCQHIVAARRLIGRYKGPGSKEAILACVNRKAKQMGCDKSEDKVIIPKEETKQDTMPILTQEQKMILIDSLKTEGLIKANEPCQECLTLQQHIKVLNYLHDSLGMELEELNKENKTLLVDSLIQLKAIAEGPESVKDQVELMKTFEERTMESLKDSINDLRKKVSVNEIQKKLNQETPPEIKPEDSPIKDTVPSVPKVEDKQEIKDDGDSEAQEALKKYKRLQKTNSIKADRFHQLMVEKGIFKSKN